MAKKKGPCIKRSSHGKRRCLKRAYGTGRVGPSCRFGVVKRGRRKGACLKHRRARK
jgi:hypothetical protein